MDANSGKEAAVPHNIINGTHSQLIAFLVLNVWTSHFALPILLFIVLAKKVQRHPTFANLIAVFIIVGMQFPNDVLSDYTRENTKDQNRPKHYVFSQASLLYGVPAMYIKTSFLCISHVKLIFLSQ
ncbi:hypothetical protein MPER_12211 [Moniliophthora perniciosa FA553]|nr:hypothetical protein MPER_12211 [Moniliophthora perniciosa FA553]